MPDVTVIIPALNAAETLPRQLKALAAQIDAPPFDIVISDNGSKDDTTAVVGQWSRRLSIHLVDSAESKGASYARNKGATQATGMKLLFCDADDVVSPQWVERMSSALDRGRMLVSGPIVRVTQDTPEGWIPDDPQYGSPLGDYMGLMPCVLAGSMAIWREDYLALGGYDNSYRGGCEDVDFSWRAQSAGLVVSVATGCFLYYHPRTGARAVFKQARGYASQGILLWVRFRDRNGIQGPSFKWSLLAIGREILALRLSTVRDAGARSAWVGRFGAHLGSVEGHVRYRMLRRVPDRALGPGPH